MRPAALALICVLSLKPVFARLEQSICGSYRDRAIEEHHLHARAVASHQSSATVPIPGAGDIAILEDSGGVVARRNAFDLDQKTVQFSLVSVTANQYSYQTSGASYDATAASSGSTIRLGDDDSASFSLPFPFPFFEPITRKYL